MQIEEITTTEGLEALRAEWTGLWERCPDATPFQSPEWLLAWWRHLGRGWLWTLALRCKGRLAGLAPLFVHRPYGLPLRCVSILGTGVTDYLDVLMERACQDSAVGFLLEHLAEHSARWDYCDFEQLRQGSPLLSEGTDGALLSCVSVQEVCPVLALPEDPGSLRARLPAGLRKNLRYYERRLAREDEARFERADETNVEALLDALFRLHQERWNRRLLPGCFARGPVRRFHKEVTAAFLERGWLRLDLLRIGGRPVGALYCFLCRGRVYYYAAGLARDAARISPGSLLIAHALEEAIRNGAAEFDFLRGNEPYKYRWGARDRTNYRRLLWNSSPRGKLAALLNRGEERAERAIKRLARWLARTPAHGR